MSRVAELRGLADMFGWSTSSDDFRRTDTFIFGPNMVTVDYSCDGVVREGRRYEFLSIEHPQLRERTGERNKRADVRNWLIQLGR